MSKTEREVDRMADAINAVGEHIGDCRTLLDLNCVGT
jgi:hypothetical protein